MSRKIPVHEQVYRKLREMILYGELAPGQAVTIYGLVDELDVGMTPVREAIRRLTAEGALVFQGNRRVSLPDLSRNDLEDIAFVRRSIEPKLAMKAAENITPEIIEAMATIDAKLNEAIEKGNVSEYMRYNHKFHFTLYAEAHSELLYSMVSTLWLRYGPLYRVISGRWGTQQLADCHDETIAALSNGDIQGVGDAILADMDQGFGIVRKLFD